MGSENISIISQFLTLIPEPNREPKNRTGTKPNFLNTLTDPKSLELKNRKSMPMTNREFVKSMQNKPFFFL